MHRLGYNLRILGEKLQLFLASCASGQCDCTAHHGRIEHHGEIRLWGRCPPDWVGRPSMLEKTTCYNHLKAK